jgi:hypothetical protein
MQIAANALLVLLIPLTILTASCLRELQRAQGPDTIGPAFVLVIAGVARWVVAAIALGLMIACGRFAGMTSQIALQVLLIYSGFALVDAAAGFAIHATSPKSIAASAPVQQLGQILGFGLPLAVLVLLIVRLNIAAPATTPTFLGFFALVIIAVPTLAGYQRINARTVEENRRQNQAYWDEQRRLIAQCKADLAGLPADAPLEKILPYLIDEWPTEVRSDAFAIMERRQHIFEELGALLGGPNRDLALAYIAQLSDVPAADFAAVVRDRLVDQAVEWRDRARANLLSDDQCNKLSRHCEQASGVSFKFREGGVDYHPVFDAWKSAIDAAPAQSPYIQSAQNTLLFWHGRGDENIKPPLQPAN